MSERLYYTGTLTVADVDFISGLDPLAEIAAFLGTPFMVGFLGFSISVLAVSSFIEMVKQI